MNSVESHRPLSPIERIWTFMHELSPLHVTAAVRIEGALSPASLAAAARAAVAAYPLLRVRIEARPDGGDPWFDPELPIRTVPVDSSDTAAAHRVTEQEQVWPLDPGRAPLARLVDVVRGAGTADESHVLLLTAAHVISDGRGLMSVLRYIIEAAWRFESEGTEPVVASRVPLPATDDLLPRGSRNPVRAAAVTVTDMVTTAIQRPLRLRIDAQVPLRERRTRFVRRQLSRDQVDLLTAACRERSVTVQGVLLAALAVALGADLDAAAGACLTIGSAVDIREQLVPRVDPDALGFYAATLPIAVKCGPGVDFWTIAGDAAVRLRARLDRRTHLTMFAATRMLTPRGRGRAARMIELVDRNGPINTFVTNIGRVDLPERVGTWTLSEAEFSGGLSCTGRLAVSVTTHGGAMCLNFMYVGGLLSAERVERIAGRTVAALLANSAASR
ncbi:hypothetical protein GFY24_01495 [Nocardia sp. SYP-A9097]|uniref:phthiocerol/phthiodiolone dimycocerosyl transferase family protein n=1 Tax=Nocardia sp. SYP-A9097 TaxID=2663237 RepID=UPI00129A189A|nr:hypothetical protein [Nocardia sp. SYP-A9097]MRH86149.1 hypothetical protein [Nocardia sp. SYP-A9097]